jgi:hypothetical protein
MSAAAAPLLSIALPHRTLVAEDRDILIGISIRSSGGVRDLRIEERAVAARHMVARFAVPTDDRLQAFLRRFRAPRP